MKQLDVDGSPPALSYSAIRVKITCLLFEVSNFSSYRQTDRQTESDP